MFFVASPQFKAVDFNDSGYNSICHMDEISL